MCQCKSWATMVRSSSWLSSRISGRLLSGNLVREKNMFLPFCPTHITNPDLTTQPFKSREKGGLVQCSQLVNHHSIRALNHEHDIKMSITNAIIYNHRNQFGLINANYYMHIHAMFAMLSISSILPITGSFPKQSWQSEMHDKVVYILA